MTNQNENQATCDANINAPKWKTVKFKYKI